MNNLSLMGSCQQVVMINLRTIKSQAKKTFRQFQNSHGTVPFTFVLYSKIRAVVFSKQFWVVDAPFERSSPSRLQFSQHISQRFTAPSGHAIIQDSPWLQPTLEKSDSLGTKSHRKRLWDYMGARRSKQTRGIQCGMSQRGLVLTELQIAIRSRLLFQTTKSQKN